ncbi:hypothetical protein C1637_18545 [Chryseobacterium lactis]|uniref:Phage tail protein n=1 Tax=Chryseobacterium lactis TaxID=1241981 RepID=A0A3G6RJM4_CHRLC|nr:hypothetical protein [Chryseobacterium lactis]AZA84782.1 hypothetical protein EG342_24050 [Chryseobacterium lactis]AZB05171.1 hypothetical protein EG341_14930 [Chryseobacterium lactis]PNW12153.1 hypothetical protein C1637_18545 [Chryseobacterium lactis]
MANINITSSECAWSHFEVKLLSKVIKGLRGFSTKKTVESEHIYGSGAEPIDIMKGNTKYEGNVKLLGFEADALNRAAQIAGYDDITEVPHELIVITISYKKKATDKVTTIVTSGVQFTEDGFEMEQGAKNREVTLPYIAMSRRMI